MRLRDKGSIKEQGGKSCSIRAMYQLSTFRPAHISDGNRFPIIPEMIYDDIFLAIPQISDGNSFPVIPQISDGNRFPMIISYDIVYIELAMG